MPQAICIFEDKKFSNFFPLSLSQPVFELRIGFGSLRQRLQDEFSGVAVHVLCREYLAPVMACRLPDTIINKTPDVETIFLNGRLISYGEELKGLLDDLPKDGIAVKGGYVVAARLGKGAAADFAGYIQKRISAESIDQLCAEIRNFAQTGAVKSPPKKLSTIRSAEAGEGTYEDAYAIGQDSLAEKLPRELTSLIEKNGLSKIDSPDARLLSFPWQLIDENPVAIADDFNKLPFRGQSEESIIYPGVQMVSEDNIVIGESAVIKPGVVLDASDGPIAIGDNSVVMPNASLVGPVSIGKNCVVKAGAKWEVLDSHDFGEGIMATPVIRDGQIFVRTDVGLHCFGYDKR